MKRSEANIEIRWDTGRCHSEASKPCIRQSPGQIFILNTYSKRRQKSPKVAAAVPENIVNNGKQNRAILHGVGVWRDGKLYSSSLVSSSDVPGRSDLRWESFNAGTIYSLSIDDLFNNLFSNVFNNLFQNPNAWKFSSNPDTLVLMGKRTNSFFIPTITKWQQDCLRIPTFWNY